MFSPGTKVSYLGSTDGVSLAEKYTLYNVLINGGILFELKRLARFES
jgi:hypothetical protein